MRVVRGLKIPALVVICLTVPLSPCRTQTNDDSAMAIRHIRILASDRMEGRDTGTPGFERAVEYVAKEFLNLGLVPLEKDRSYIREFPFPYYFSSRKHPTLVVDKRSFEATDQDFSLLEYSGGGKIAGEVVFAGYGISDPKNGFDEYRDVDVRGKIVLVMHGGPDKYDRISKNIVSDSGKAAVAMKKGALGMLLSSDFREGQTAIGRWSLVPGIYDKDFIAFAIDERVFRFLMKTPRETDRAFRRRWRQEKDLLDKERRTMSCRTGKKAVLEADVTFDPSRIGTNVIGVIPGTDPELKDETVVVGAHLDHEGIRYGEIYNGADDNASGSAAVIESARQICKDPVGPGRTVVFACWGGEERGFLGSEHYVEHPPFPLENTVAYINMDMVGQGSGLRFSGVYLAPNLWDLLVGKLDKDWFPFLEPGRGGLGGSDHTPFLLKGVPGFSLMTFGKNIHTDYHEPEDDPETIDSGLLDRVSNLAKDVTLILANEKSDLIPEGRFASIRYKLAFVSNADPIAFEPERIPLDSIRPSHVDFQWMSIPNPFFENDPDGSYARLIRALNVFQMDKEQLGMSRRNAGQATRERTEFFIGIRNDEWKFLDPAQLRGAIRSGLEYFVFKGNGGRWITENGGITDEGRKAVEELNRGNVLVVLDSVPVRSVLEMVDLSKQSVLVSGIDDAEVLGDSLIDLLKDHDAVVGLVFREGSDPKNWIRKVKALRGHVFLRHVSVDLRKTSSLPQSDPGVLLLALSIGLRDSGFSEEEIENFIGRNLRRILPQRQNDRGRFR